LPDHETGEPAVPPALPQPATGTGLAIPYHVNMHVDPRRLALFALKKIKNHASSFFFANKVRHVAFGTDCVYHR
jgi:hypothetical protein